MLTHIHTHTYTHTYTHTHTYTERNNKENRNAKVKTVIHVEKQTILEFDKNKGEIIT